MMQVDVMKCTGCGDCLDACTVEAISLVAGRAFIDTDICAECGECANVCANGAISTAEVAIAVKPETGLAISSQERIPLTKGAYEQPVTAVQQIDDQGSTARQVARWLGPVFSWVSRDLLPVFADAVVATLDRKLSYPTETPSTGSLRALPQDGGRKRRLRQRRRNRKF